MTEKQGPSLDYLMEKGNFPMTLESISLLAIKLVAVNVTADITSRENAFRSNFAQSFVAQKYHFRSKIEQFETLFGRIQAQCQTAGQCECRNAC